MTRIESWDFDNTGLGVKALTVSGPIASASEVFLALCGRWRESESAERFRQMVAELKTKRVVGASLGFDDVLSAIHRRCSLRYVSLRDVPWSHLPWAVWARGEGNCLGTGLLIRWVCESVGVPSQGVLLGRHYLLRVQDGRRMRYVDRVRVRRDDVAPAFMRRHIPPHTRRRLSLREELALLVQAQSCVSLGHFGRREAAMAEAELAMGLGRRIPLIRRHYARLKVLTNPCAKKGTSDDRLRLRCKTPGAEDPYPVLGTTPTPPGADGVVSDAGLQSPL